MKDSKKYAKNISKLYRNLKQHSDKIKKVNYEDPIEAVVYATVSESMKSTSARNATKKLSQHFVDLNDLRVSRVEEIVDIFGVDTEASMKTAGALTGTLNSIFNKFNTVSLSELTEVGKRQAKKDIESLKHISNFVTSYCFLTAFHGHAIPLTQEMIDYLKVNDLVHGKSSASDISGFLERQITVANAYEFYWLLREESEKQSKKTQKVVREIAAKAAKEEAAKKKKMAKKKAAKKSAKNPEKKSTKKRTSKKVTKENSPKKTTKKPSKKKTVTKKKTKKKVKKS